MVAAALTFRMENNGDVISLSNTDESSGYVKAEGRSGFGVSPTSVTIIEGAGGGGRWRNSRRGPREMIMPIYIFGIDRQEIEDRMRRLTRLFNDTYSTPSLIAEYPDNNTSFSTDFHYAGGADPQYGQDTNGRTYAKLVLALRAPDPYWTARDALSYSLRAANAGRGLIKTGNGGLTRLQISSSQAIGTISLSNSGDVDAFPTWSIKGPGDSFTATRNIDGAFFSYTSPILIADVITINTKNKTVIDQSGANRYTSLATAPKLFSIPAGDSTISVAMGNATADTVISMFFLPRRELVFG